MNTELRYQNKKIFYRITGSGKPVLLIHGFGEDGDVWQAQTAYLQEKFRLIIPDLPGSGKSELIDDMKPPQTPPQEGLLNSPGSEPLSLSQAKNFKLIIPDLPGSGRSEVIDDMSIEGMAEVIYTIIHEEHIESCPVIGHSMGGYITLALVEKYPNHVSAFGLFHSTAFADSAEKKATRRKGIEFIQQHGAFEFLKTSIPNLFSPESKEKMPERISEFINRQHNFSDQALVLYYEAMMKRPDRAEQLRKATVPVLFIMGKYDNAIPMADALQQCHLPEKSYIHILQKSGHMGMIEEAEACTRILDKFLLEI